MWHWRLYLLLHLWSDLQYVYCCILSLRLHHLQLLLRLMLILFKLCCLKVVICIVSSFFFLKLDYVFLNQMILFCTNDQQFGIVIYVLLCFGSVECSSYDFSISCLSQNSCKPSSFMISSTSSISWYQSFEYLMLQLWSRFFLVIWAPMTSIWL